MKKSVIAIAVVAAAVVVGAPYVTGSIAESETRKIAEMMSSKPAEYGVATITAYERGYRSSTVSYDYELPVGLAVMTGAEGVFKYDCDYSHGIVGIDYSCHFNGNEGYAKFVTEHFNGEDPLSITGDISAFGGWSQELSTKLIDQTMEDGTVMKIEPSRIVVESDSGMSAFDSTAKIGAINISDKDGTLKMQPSVMDWVLKPTESGLFEADYSMEVGEFDFAKDGQNVKMSGVSMTGENVERGDKMDSSVMVKMKTVSADGPSPFSVEDAVISMDFLGVSSEALLEYQEFVNSMQDDLMASLDTNGELDIDPNQMMALLPVIEKMLDKDLNLKMAFSGDLMGKPNALDIDIKLLEKMSFAQFSAFMFNPESVLEKLTVNLNTSLNKELIDSNPAVAPMISNSPLFSKDGSSYETKIKLGAESEVNGKKVTFQELQSMVMSGMM